MSESEKKDPDWVEQLPATSDLIIGTAHGVLVRIKPDGSLEYGPQYRPDEAARVFWEAMARQRTKHDEQRADQRLISQHVEALVARLGALDIYCEAMRHRVLELAGSGKEGSVVLEARRAVSVLERVNHQVIELGRGLAQRPDVDFGVVPEQIPRVVAQNPNSTYDPANLPDDEEIGPPKPKSDSN